MVKDDVCRYQTLMVGRVNSNALVKLSVNLKTRDQKLAKSVFQKV